MSVTGMPTNAMLLIFMRDRFVAEPVGQQSDHFWIEPRALSFERVGQTQIMLKCVTRVRNFVEGGEIPIPIHITCDQFGIFAAHDPIERPSKHIGWSFHAR